MSKQNKSTQAAVDDAAQSAKPAGKKPGNWLKISIIANIVLVVVIAGGIAALALLNQSNTNPSFCGTCHIMQANVNSYLTSNNLDNIHYQAGVQCKDCHDYPVQAEITSGVKFVLGNYEVDSNGELTKRDFGDEICTQCHISYEHVATETRNVARNPHDNHIGQMPCSTCHTSHGEQTDYCGQCHDNGGQTIFGKDS